jgi:hypothetical protein
MGYRHRIIEPSRELRRLAVGASLCAAIRLELPYSPAVNFFIEDPNGRFERDVRCAGFVDYFSHRERLDVFVRAGRAMHATIETVWHESFHLHEFVYKLRTPLALSELRAGRFGLQAPWGTYNDMMRAFAEEIEVFVNARGDREEMTTLSAARARRVQEQNEWIETVRARLRYTASEDNEDGEQDGIDDDGDGDAMPPRVEPLDAYSLTLASRYLKENFNRTQQRAAIAKRYRDEQAVAERMRRLKDARDWREIERDWQRWNKTPMPGVMSKAQ